MTDNKKASLKELGRFLVCGIASTIVDYLLCQLMILLLNKCAPNLASGWVIGITTAVGFLGGVILNYFLSTFWVYQNVAKKENTKKGWFILLFILFSFGAFLLSWGTMQLCELISTSAWSISITSVSLFSLIKEYGINFLAQPVFWIYFVAFILKTIVGLTFNYFTRKYILYKAPKEIEKKID